MPRCWLVCLLEVPPKAELRTLLARKLLLRSLTRWTSMPNFAEEAILHEAAHYGALALFGFDMSRAYINLFHKLGGLIEARFGLVTDNIFTMYSAVNSCGLVDGNCRLVNRNKRQPPHP